MILQRLATSIRKQDWFTVLIETLIVVLGVFLGIQLGNWNAAQADRKTERVMLERLVSDFQQIVADEKHFLETVTAAQSGADTLMQHVADNQLPEETASLCALLAPSRAFRPAVPASATYTQLVSNGDMRLIGDEALRQSLAEFESQRTGHETAFAMSLDTALLLLQPYWSAVDICDANLRTSDDRFAGRLREIVGSPEFAGAVSGLLTQHSNAVRAHTATLEHAEATLSRLERELDQ